MDLQIEPVRTLSPDAGRAVLQAAWSAVRSGVGQLPAKAPARRSALAGWNVGDLIAHLGRSLDALAAARPAIGDPDPMTLREFLTTLRSSAPEIAEITRALAIAAGNEPLAALDAAWQRAVATLDELGSGERVVLARRGPIGLGDLVASRVLELVVHSDDISRSLPERPPLRLPDAAVSLVSRALLGVIAEASPGDSVRLAVADLGAITLGRGGGGDGAVRTDQLTWIRVACGRLSWQQALAEHSLVVEPEPAEGDDAPDGAEPQRAQPGRPDLSGVLPLV